MKRRVVVILFAVVLVSALLYANTPKHRIERFVFHHGDQLAAAMETDGGIPADIGIRLWNAWTGVHEMTEFILWTRGNTYYGCYYTPQDVPLAFQNTDLPLKQGTDGVWSWCGEGDNQGSTWRIKPHWYGFEASF